MAVGFPIQDELGGYFHQLWNKNEAADVVKKVLANENLWDDDLTSLPGFTFAAQNYLESMMRRLIICIEGHHLNNEKAERNEA